jgi:hypothetical protein
MLVGQTRRRVVAVALTLCVYEEEWVYVQKHVYEEEYVCLYLESKVARSRGTESQW